MHNGNDGKLCATCHERPREKGQSYCREDRKIFQKRYYDQMRSSEGVLVRVRRRKELMVRLEAQPIVTVYWDSQRRCIRHGFCSKPVSPVGAKETGFGTEFELYCAACHEEIWLSEFTRLREWDESADDRTSLANADRFTDLRICGPVALAG